ncbi:hypothetical protein TorRG33x02_263280 [Trema orientale]|uniref:Uncharacterized protein n=1 Tax=Trema orientale TaxID=63057 RepID=A0A2P5D450_TREOI|nr:hypothetical protein TorRG33x02_263280 [Trema orientale]
MSLILHLLLLIRRTTGGSAIMIGMVFESTPCESCSSWRGEVVEPEDAIDVANDVVDNEFEEFYGFEFEGGDEAEGLEARKEGSMAREKDWFKGDLGEREDLMRPSFLKPITFSHLILIQCSLIRSIT